MSETLLLGTGNLNKVTELRHILEGLPWDVRGLADFSAVEEPEEDGATFEENALKKARYYGERFGVICVADDSGLMVDALHGAPGVHSARYAGEACSYADNNEKLLDALKAFPWPERAARFVCCAALVFPDGREHVEQGTVTGHIAMEGFGNNGFGYDPLFVPEGWDCTFGEMQPVEKHAISHRGRAFERMRAYLEALS